MQLIEMTDAETAAHIRQWVKENHGIFAWPTDACGYKQHMRFVKFRNDNYERSGTDEFFLEYADKLERGEIPEFLPWINSKPDEGEKERADA